MRKPLRRRRAPGAAFRRRFRQLERPPKFKLVASTKWDGGGFLNSGIFVNSGPPLIESYKITFTKAGKYKYICTVHDDMKGEVDVG